MKQTFYVISSQPAASCQHLFLASSSCCFLNVLQVTTGSRDAPSHQPSWRHNPLKSDSVKLRKWSLDCILQASLGQTLSLRLPLTFCHQLWKVKNLVKAAGLSRAALHQRVNDQCDNEWLINVTVCKVLGLVVRTRKAQWCRSLDTAV